MYIDNFGKILKFKENKNLWQLFSFLKKLKFLEIKILKNFN